MSQTLEEVTSTEPAPQNVQKAPDDSGTGTERTGTEEAGTAPKEEPDAESAPAQDKTTTTTKKPKAKPAPSIKIGNLKVPSRTTSMSTSFLRNWDLRRMSSSSRVNRTGPAWPTPRNLWVQTCSAGLAVLRRACRTAYTGAAARCRRELGQTVWPGRPHVASKSKYFSAKRRSTGLLPLKPS